MGVWFTIKLLFVVPLGSFRELPITVTGSLPSVLPDVVSLLDFVLFGTFHVGVVLLCVFCFSVDTARSVYKIHKGESATLDHFTLCPTYREVYGSLTEITLLRSVCAVFLAPDPTVVSGVSL